MNPELVYLVLPKGHREFIEAFLARHGKRLVPVPGQEDHEVPFLVISQIPYKLPGGV